MSTTPMQRIVAFTLQGCPHCAGVPELLRSTADLAPAHIIDAKDPLCTALGVSSFPTIMLVNPVLAFRYSKERTPEALRGWVLRKMRQTSEHIASARPAAPSRPVDKSVDRDGSLFRV